MNNLKENPMPFGRPKKDMTSIQNIGAKLSLRKVLYKKRKFICDICLIFAIIGILLMITYIELAIFKVSNNKYTNIYTSTVIKLGISFTTLVTLIFLVWYHILNIKVFMIDNGMEDCRLAISLSRILVIGLEFIICLIHPFPGSRRLKLVSFFKKEKKYNPSPQNLDMIPVDVFLSLPMFLRFFLVCRVLMLHSQLYQDASAQSLGALNKIRFNFSFVFKSLMTLYAEYVLTIMITFAILWASWALRACEIYQGEAQIDFFDSLWVITITFLTVGYGDIVPQTKCGKAISVMTGTFGVGCTALVVAVLARKLELSRAELYVHNFVISIEQNKQRKTFAANVIKEGWLIYKYRKLGVKRAVLKHERRLLQAIRRVKELKNDQSKVTDNTLSMIEIYRSQIYIQKCIENTQEMMHEIHTKLIKQT